MKIFDITVSINPKLPTWPGDPKVSIERFSKIEEGEDANVSRLDISVHTGTHVDAPFHFVDGGRTVDQLLLNDLIGPAQVVELPEEVEKIDAVMVGGAGIIPGTRRVLFKTQNSKLWSHTDEFQENFVAITADGAEELVKLGIRLVGVDYLSVAPFDDPVPTHRILLSNQVIAIEGVNLTDVPAGHYELICLPMKLEGCDGAPARVVLISD